MKIEDYNKYCIQGSDHYLIPKDVFKELFNEMVNWKEENKKLNGAIQTYNILLKSNVEENKKLKDNWNKLKEWVKNNIKHWEEQEKQWCELDIIKADRKSNIKIIFKMLLDIIQELEGSDSNE